MQFTITASALLALATSVLAQTPDFNPVYTPESDATLDAGAPFEVTWDAPAKYADEKISISLIGGADQGSQQPLAVVATGIDNSAKSFTWTPESDLVGQKVYGLVFKLESNPEVFQYSKPFHLAAGDYEEPPKDDDKVTTTVTTATGKVTVTLSSVSTTETPCTTTTAAWTTKISSKPVTTTTSVSNTTSTSTTAYTVPTTVVEVPEQPSAPVEEPTTVPENAGNVAGASTFALLGGLVVAMLAL